jgi:hypothetical protein
VTDTSDRPGDEPPPTQIAELPQAERRALAALAIVGRASLSAEELSALAEVDEIAPLLADLERRGLIRGEGKKRYSTLGRVGEEIRKTDDALSTGEQLLQYVTTLAKGGQLTPERLLDDAEAVLGLTEWAAEMRKWEGLLKLVKTVQASFEIARRVEEWRTLLNRGLSAARVLGDWRSEVWMLRQLATASARADDTTAERQYLHDADAVQREHQPGPPSARDDGDVPNREATVVNGVDTGGRIATWMLCLIAAGAAAAGGATGYAIGNSSAQGSIGPTTTRIPVTATVEGRTVSTYTTVTLPTRTVLSTKTVTKTATAPPRTVTVTSPPVTVTTPPTTVTSPPVTVTSPPITVTSPPVTVTAPPRVE